MHDDWRAWSPFDEHSILPTMIGADCVISSSYALVPNPTRSLLEHHECWPTTTIELEPTDRHSPIEDLLASPVHLEKVKSLIDERGLRISLFYPNHPSTSELFKALGHVPSGKGPEDDTNPDHRSRCLSRLMDAGLPVLTGGILGGPATKFSDGDLVVCKMGVRPPFRSTFGEIRSNPFFRESYVEAWVNVKKSYCVHFGPDCEVFGANSQLISAMSHAGNSSLREPNDRLISLAVEAARAIKSSAEIYAIDLIEAVDGTLFINDVNERFNTSSYVHLFLNKVFDGNQYIFLLKSGRCDAQKYQSHVEELKDSVRSFDDFAILLGGHNNDNGQVGFYTLSAKAR